MLNFYRPKLPILQCFPAVGLDLKNSWALALKRRYRLCRNLGLGWYLS